MLIFLVLMLSLIISAVLFYEDITKFLYRPHLYSHLLFLHIFSVTLFFGNAVAGMLWEFRSLRSEDGRVIFHTYKTVAWLDARFSSPLIILSVISGIMLSIMAGDIWQIGWLSLSFFLFIFSGAVWVISDIPTQYKIKELSKDIDPEHPVYPPELMRVLKMRLWISLLGVIPLIIVFFLMVYKPEITALN